jgi:hypothetical protein
MMARSTRFNLRPDTLMQDRHRQIDETLLRRTAGPYIRVKSGSGRVPAMLRVRVQKLTSPAALEPQRLIETEFREVSPCTAAPLSEARFTGFPFRQPLPCAKINLRAVNLPKAAPHSL